MDYSTFRMVNGNMVMAYCLGITFTWLISFAKPSAWILYAYPFVASLSFTTKDFQNLSPVLFVLQHFL